VVPTVGEKQAVYKQTTHIIHLERLNLKKLNEEEGKEQCHVEMTNRFALCKTKMLRWILIELGKLLEII
jgi:hypothetical protein